MTKSEHLFERAVKRIPGGVNSPVRAFGSVGGTPLFITKAKGSKIYDADGREYIDYVCSWGPGILGHAHPQVVKKVQEACEDGLTFGAPTEKEIILAELIQECMPVMELVRLVNSGTEAVMSAIRVARGFTGRDLIVKCIGCYHGHADGLLVKAGSAALAGGVPDSAGVPNDYTKNTLLAPYNDLPAIMELFEEHGKEIAAVIVEPVAANMGVVAPVDGFLEGLRKITKEYGALLIFDEVITGFRLGLGGATEYFGIKPDLVTLGKIAGGGMPLAAYGGKKEIMELVAPLGPVYQAGTLSGNPIATTAGIETIRLLQENPLIYAELEEKSEKLEAAVKERFGEFAQANRIASLMSVFFASRPVEDFEGAVQADKKRYANYFHYLLEQGIYMAPSGFEAMFLSAAHTKEDINRTCEVIKDYEE